MNRTPLAITMGDPAGIGPEITLRAVDQPDLTARYTPILVGSVSVYEAARQLIEASVKLAVIDDPGEASRLERGVIGVIEPPSVAGHDYVRGKVDAACGDAAFTCIAKGIEMAMAGQVGAVVTNPIHKQALNLAGHHYAGHTEIFRDLTGASDSAMMLVAGTLRVAHVSTHCSLAEAARRATTERVGHVIDLAADALKRLGVAKPRIAVAALNPHAGEDGLFGDEDEKQIRPAVEAAVAKGLEVTGPWPGDTVFSMAAGGRFDAVIAQYHDQGHIPVKLLGFKYDAKAGGWTSVRGINLTLGLPILRVSVDHGTAFDQAWQGTATAESLIDAIEFAILMTGQGSPG